MFWKINHDGVVSSQSYASSSDPERQKPFPSQKLDLQVIRFRSESRLSHVLIASTESKVFVNGRLVLGGLCVLDHKDEIRVANQQWFFSAEQTPLVQSFQRQADARSPKCPICRAAIHQGQSVVRCPGCDRLHHQIDGVGDTLDRHCWTYSDQCRFCQHPTALSGQPGWRPDPDDFF